MSVLKEFARAGCVSREMLEPASKEDVKQGATLYHINSTHPTVASELHINYKGMTPVQRLILNQELYGYAGDGKLFKVKIEFLETEKEARERLKRVKSKKFVK